MVGGVWYRLRCRLKLLNACAKLRGYFNINDDKGEED